MTARFVHLHVHTEYSIVDGVIRVPALVQLASELRMPAITVTEQGNLFSAVKFYRAAQERGVKPIIGAEIMVRDKAGQSKPSNLVLLCQNRRGFENLSELITRSYTEGQTAAGPMVDSDWLGTCNSGLIAMSAGLAGDIGSAFASGNARLAAVRCAEWHSLFPERFYLEIQRTGRPGEREYIDAILRLAGEMELPVVASNDVRFLAPQDFEAHEARVCIQEGRTLSDARRHRRYSEAQYLRSVEEMQKLFQDLPEALENSVHIATRCNVELEFGQYHLPEFPVPEGHSVNEWLRSETEIGLEKRLSVAGAAPGFEQTNYRGRLDAELDVIVKMGFAGYFLIVADFIKWARDNGVPVGPGRGSGAGSLAAYALEITDLDPLAYDLLFERFLNPERVSMPDFDVDFCMDRRDDVIEYVKQRYGRDRVSQIITYGSMAAKAVVRDVGRVLGHPYGFVDLIAKLIPFDLNMTLDRALAEEPALKKRYEEEEEVRALLDLAKKLEGLVRNAGKHAGGVVISPRQLTEFMPLYCERGSDITVTQFDMGDVEAIGLVKFDFLGLRTLTVIDWAVTAVNETQQAVGGPEIDITRIALDDNETFELIQRSTTTAVFQLESRGMKDLIKRLQPDKFEDLIALVALFRPGPLQSGMVEDFIDRKHGRAQVQYSHPALEPILKPTYGVILYQEQVMQIARELAGYTLGAADLLRRAMGKKKAEEMASQREDFVAGAAERGVGVEIATPIFDLIEKFAGYGFNKSHSAAYALVAYQTAWLKAHHSAAFMAAVLSADMDNSDKVFTLIDECRSLKLKVLQPDLNECAYKFAAADECSIRYGLGAIKGAGQAAIEAIVNERESAGLFMDLFDVCKRIDLRKANRRVLEALIRAGALDSIGPNRNSLIHALDEALSMAEQHVRDREAGQDDMFGLSESGASLDEVVRIVELEEWPESQRLAAEKGALGLYLTGHPILRYAKEIEQFITCDLSGLTPGRRRVAGLLSGTRSSRGRRGRVVFATIDDHRARADITIYSDLLEKVAEVLVDDQILVIEGNCALDEFTGQYALVAESIWSLEQARQLLARRLVVDVNAERASNGFVDELKRQLSAQTGGPCPITISYRRDDACTRIRLGEAWNVYPTDALLDGMQAKFGEHAVRLEYK